ncbi:Asp-tRNA(Asn)/Glu-tRNA(Gln) amidotransferase subunit GatB [bacterium]|nr:MAG: Asp-tRNA(Asn)/Glu-tRNA(Gln) amidotransferase subunit GatB [bacterium]
MNYETVIGLEVHVQLKTKTKAFCGCSTEFGNEPNSQVCPVCLGFPGVLPVLNKIALDYAVKVGLALGCKIPEYTKFDRKHYYYPDLPKNYQISQYDLPLATHGVIEIKSENKLKNINILRVHFEEDAGKLIHKEDFSLVDFNRSGMPLLEIVSQPEINSPQEAYDYLTVLKSIIEYLEVSDCDMEKGSLRCDANISLRPQGVKELGVKTEIKNMNSFKAVKDALTFEISRQTGILNNGEAVVHETRLWDAKISSTFSMRSKEEAKDYRYFPEPDLPPFIIGKNKISEIKSAIPELPKEKIARFVKEYGLSEYDAGVLVISKTNADFTERCFKEYKNTDKKPIVNWLIGPVLSAANDKNCYLEDLKVSPGNLAELVDVLERGEISNLTAKSVLLDMVDSGKSARDIIKEKNLSQISDVKSLEDKADEVIKENAKSVQDYKAGKSNAVMFLVGQVMKKTSGKANPKVVQEVLKRRLSDA